MSKEPSSGSLLLAVLKTKGISQTNLARAMKRPIKTINEIIHGKARLTEETAIQLEKHLGIPAEAWMALETQYRLKLARNKS